MIIQTLVLVSEHGVNHANVQEFMLLSDELQVPFSQNHCMVLRSTMTYAL